MWMWQIIWYLNTLYSIKPKNISINLSLKTRLISENIAKGLNILQESINNLSDISKVRIEGRIKKQKDQYLILAPLK